jgi:hypothetical protein
VPGFLLVALKSAAEFGNVMTSVGRDRLLDCADFFQERIASGLGGLPGHNLSPAPSKALFFPVGQIPF